MKPTPPWMLPLLVVVLLFLLGVTAFVALRRGIPAMLFLAVDIAAIGLIVGRLAERRQRSAGLRDDLERSR